MSAFRVCLHDVFAQSRSRQTDVATACAPPTWYEYTCMVAQVSRFLCSKNNEMRICDFVKPNENEWCVFAQHFSSTCRIKQSLDSVKRLRVQVKIMLVVSELLRKWLSSFGCLQQHQIRGVFDHFKLDQSVRFSVQFQVMKETTVSVLFFSTFAIVCCNQGWCRGTWDCLTRTVCSSCQEKGNVQQCSLWSLRSSVFNV